MRKKAVPDLKAWKVNIYLRVDKYWWRRGIRVGRYKIYNWNYE